MTRRVSEIESTLRNLEDQLKQTIASLENKLECADQLGKTISAQMFDLQNQLREMRPGASPETLIDLEEGSVVNIEELEKRLDEKCSLVTASEGKLRDFQTGLSKELDELRAEIREKDLLSTAREIEMKSLKQNLSTRMEELEKLVKGQSGGENKSPRPVSFLVDIGKKDQ